MTIGMVKRRWTYLLGRVLGRKRKRSRKATQILWEGPFDLQAVNPVDDFDLVLGCQDVESVDQVKPGQTKENQGGSVHKVDVNMNQRGFCSVVLPTQ